MSSESIDMISLSPGTSIPEWEYGSVIQSVPDPAQLKKDVAHWLEKTTAEWVLFWDFTAGNPDAELLQKLASRPVDIFHAGLRYALRGLPDVLNYVHPTWMYNADAGDDVEHTNFRLSLRGCMVRVSVFKKAGLFHGIYSSVEMEGIAFGYSMLKQGAIVRYNPGIVKNNLVRGYVSSLADEWIFARQFFTSKWQYWTLLNKRGFTRNLQAWLAAKNVKYIPHKPMLHSSEKTEVRIPYATVSILAPTLDRYSYLHEELKELNEQTILPHEVLITDQTDKDRRQSIDAGKYPNLTIKYFPQNEKGQCLAWNKLIKEATGEYIFFFGDDAYNIPPGFIEKMLQTMYRFDADMVASNVIEKGIVYGTPNYHYYMADSFPITLIKRSVVEKAGGMDMFFNRNVKADHDLAMRCHLNGVLMIFDPSAEIGHHRAPSGGLRAHNARVITNFMTKNSITKLLNPSTSEIFIYNKYYTQRQFRNHVRIKYFNQLLINGNIFKKILRLLFLLYKIPAMKKEYRNNMQVTMEEFARRGMRAKQ